MEKEVQLKMKLVQPIAQCAFLKINQEPECAKKVLSESPVPILSYRILKRHVTQGSVFNKVNNNHYFFKGQYLIKLIISTVLLRDIPK